MGDERVLFGKEFRIFINENRKTKIKQCPSSNLGNNWSPFNQASHQLMGREMWWRRGAGRGQNKFLFCCFAGRNFKAVRGTATKVKLTEEHICLVSKSKISYIVHNADLTKVHLAVKNLFAGKIIPTVPLAGQLKHFLYSWKMFTRNQDILSVVEGYKIRFSTKPHQKKFLIGKRDGVLPSHHYEGSMENGNGSGTFTRSKPHVATRRIHVQLHLRRCLLFSPIELMMMMMMMMMMRPLARFLCLCVGFKSSPTDFYEASQSFGINLKETDYHDKSWNVCIDTNTRYQIFRYNSRFDLNDIVTYSRETRKNTLLVLGNVQGTSGINFRTCRIAAREQVRYLQQRPILALLKNFSY